jgi:hypothetical protein
VKESEGSVGIGEGKEKVGRFVVPIFILISSMMQKRSYPNFTIALLHFF